jgi:APA family basic amino acid/polyamine antiporter
VSERVKLKRTITLWPLIGIEVGQSVGAGVFALTGLALSMTGPSVFLAFLAAAVPVGVAMAVLAMLASAHPISGGTYFYGARLFSPVAAFTGVWSYFIGAVLGMFPLYALTGSSFLLAVFPTLPKLPVALALLFVFYVANLFGARLAMWVQAVLVVIMFGALLLFVGRGLPAVDPTNLRPLFPLGAAGFLMASAVLTFTVLGANAAVELGDEIVEPQRNIPLSFAVSIPVVTVIYVLIGLVVAGVGPWQTRAAAGSSLAGVAASFLHGPARLYFLLGGGLLAVVTTLNATYLWGTKSLLLIAEDGLIPSSVTRVNRRFGTPHWLLTIIFVASAAALLLIGERVETFAVLASLGGIVIFIPVMAAALRLRRKHPEMYARARFSLAGPLHYAAPVVGLLFCLLVIGILLVDLSSHREGWLFLAVFLLWGVVGALYARLRLQFMSRTSGK